MTKKCVSRVYMYFDKLVIVNNLGYPLSVLLYF